MALYDKNAKRIREIEREVELGNTTRERGLARIERLRQKGPEYWIKGYDSKGQYYDEPVRENPRSIKAAREADQARKVAIRTRTYTPSQLLKVLLRDLFNAHLKTLEGRGGYKAARTLCNVANDVAGHYRLQHLDDEPKPVLEVIFAHLPENWSPGTRSNFRMFIRASIQDYIDSHHKLVMKNPVDMLPMGRGTKKREEYPTYAEHLTILSHLKQHPLRWVKPEGKPPYKSGYPAYLAPLLTIRYEQGLRGMEVIPWRWEHADLEYIPGRKKPAIKTRILKKDGEIADQWVVLTPTSYLALLSLPGQKEYGPIWPVRGWPTHLCRRLFDECGLRHLWAHDYRRAWTMNNLDKDADRRKAAVGRLTDDSEEFYKVFNRKEQETFYDDEWKKWAKQELGPNQGPEGENNAFGM